MYLFSTTLSQADTSLYSSNIVGEVDFIGVNEEASNIPLKYRNTVEAIGRVSMSCTATHIGRGYVISAGHCFDATEKVERNKACQKIQVKWGFRGEQLHSLVSNCQKILVMQNKPGADYVLFQVEPFPDSYVPLETRHMSFNDTLVTLFSHPRSRPLQWSQYCKGQRLESPPRSSDFLYHQCDTNPGSSGAGIIQDSNLRLIGIHKGGLDFDSIGTWNFATLIQNTPIVNTLRKELLSAQANHEQLP